MERPAGPYTARSLAPEGITLKSPREMERMREAGRVVAQVIRALRSAIGPGVRTRDLDALARREIRRLGAKPAFLGYYGFPAVICTSLNEEIVHGIPGERAIRPGDLVKVDVGAVVDGLYADAAFTVAVPPVSPEKERLVETTRRALWAGIEQARPGRRVGDIGWAIQSLAEGEGFSVVREYVGHGIGRRLHEEPQVPNYGTPGTGPLLRAGMALAIEPMVNLGTWRTRLQPDGWTVVTADGSLSAHFEHTVLILEEGPEVVTRWEDA